MSTEKPQKNQSDPGEGSPPGAEDADLPSVKAADSGPERSEGRVSAKGPLVFGALAENAEAKLLADAAHELIFRYANEIVAAHKLCPFLHNVQVGMGAVAVGVDLQPDVEATANVIKGIGEQVVHVVFPLFSGTSSQFERFGSKLAEALRRKLPVALVHATFHPELTGGRENAHRLVGLLRQAPDPFVQFIPPGLEKGGTVMAGEDPGGAPHAEARYDRLTATGAIDALLAQIAELKTERERRYGEIARRLAATATAST